VLEIFAAPLMFGAWITAGAFTVLNAGVLLVRIRAEEQALGEVGRPC
jgi:methyltransferase